MESMDLDVDLLDVDWTIPARPDDNQAAALTPLIDDQGRKLRSTFTVTGSTTRRRIRARVAS